MAWGLQGVATLGNTQHVSWDDECMGQDDSLYMIGVSNLGWINN